MLCSKMRRSLSVGLSSLLTFVLLLTACQTESTVDEQADPELPEDELAIEDPWVRPASSGGNTALYMTVANGRSTADTLVDVRAPIIGQSQIHKTESDTGDVSSMEPIDSLAIPAEMRTVLEPGGQHVMLMDLGQSLSEEGSLVVDLVFSQSGRQRIQAPVRASDAADNQ